MIYYIHVWLEPKPRLLVVTQSEDQATAVTIRWEPALLFGHGHPVEGSGGDANPEAESRGAMSSKKVPYMILLLKWLLQEIP